MQGSPAKPMPYDANNKINMKTGIAVPLAATVIFLIITDALG
jgi:hypothetical protein